MTLPEGLPDWRRHILTDPPDLRRPARDLRAPGGAEAILAQIRAAGFAQAAIVGRFEAGPPAIRVEA